MSRSAPADASRREVIAALGAVGLMSALPRAVRAQETPKAPADPAGTLPNKTVLAEKDPAMRVHSERPLTASVTAEHLNDDVTPTGRHFIRNNLFTPSLDAGKHTVEIVGLVDKPLTFTV